MGNCAHEVNAQSLSTDNSDQRISRKTIDHDGGRRVFQGEEQERLLFDDQI
ncbi:hypothetical protein HCH_05744 [Hahella chejuensis KCTC 2396]|uniref:Uncharacterized protein n=1 Tax=Hahella chejuensis (strain KCTC 2396) TaxID=349521 RepID=Q2SAC8_HAHCH|nr:hypothetical protein HCH_05744 [Hahella chejuensis KCTC 2396]